MNQVRGMQDLQESESRMCMICNMLPFSGKQKKLDMHSDPIDTTVPFF